MSRHVVMCCGARVEIVDSEVRVLDEPLTKRCPLQTMAYGYEEIDKGVVKRKMEMKIEKLGFASKGRIFTTEPRVPYGASEMIMSCLEEGVFDCAVTVCEGAGTVLTPVPGLVQMIGAFLSGIVETTPVPEMIKRLKDCGGVVLDESTAIIDQVRGVELAVKQGYKKVAVTVAGFRSWEIPKIRKLEKKLKVDVTVFAVCTTRSEPEDAQNLLLSDLVWACNSKVVKEIVAPRAVFQLGVAIPVFALTDRGKKVLFTHLMKMKEPFVAFRARLPYLVPEKLPK